MPCTQRVVPGAMRSDLWQLRLVLQPALLPSVFARTEEEILHTFGSKGRLKTVLQASAIYAGVFLFFFLSSKVLTALWNVGVAVRDRFGKKEKHA